MKPIHYMIHVRDLERSIDFYRSVLGFEVADRHRYDGHSLAYLRGAESPFEIELIRPDRWTFGAAEQTAPTHIAFAVADLSGERARIEALGATVGPIEAYYANGRFMTRFFYVTDPDGHQIELIEPIGRYAEGSGCSSTISPGSDIMLNRALARRIAGEGFSDDPTRSYTPDAAFYFDPAIYDAELRSIFHKSWQYFCHQSELPEAGDYIAGEIAGQPVYVIRGRDGVIRGFFNVCQHRAHQLLKGKGNVKSVLRCPYHSWTYDHEGRLRGAPQCDAVAGFDRDAIRLSPIGVDIVGGFIMVNLDAGARSLKEETPHFEKKLLAMCPEAPGLKFTLRQDFEIKANWKVVVENFLENYHSFYSGPAHAQLSDIIDQSSYRWTIEDRVIEFIGRGGGQDKVPYGLGAERRFSGRPDGFQIVFLWPNTAFILLPGANMLMVFLMNPAGPERTREPLLYFGFDGELDRGTQSAVEWFNTILGPEDVDICESVQVGLHSLGYRRGRLMVDREQKCAWSEHFIHHFNSLNLEALERTG